MDDTGKKVSDAGDSSSCQSQDSVSKGNSLDNDRGAAMVSDMVRNMRRGIRRGDHNTLKLCLTKLVSWKSSFNKHNYWRVAQFVGETEIGNICILLTVIGVKPHAIKWPYLDNSLSALKFSLCNREAINKFHAFSSKGYPEINFISIFASALKQEVMESVTLNALSIIAVVVTVCRTRFAKNLVNAHFLDKLVDRLVEQDPPKSFHILDKTLEVIKSLLMCGQSFTLAYCKDILRKLLCVFEKLITSRKDRDNNEKTLKFYMELVQSTEDDDKAHICARWWTKGKLKKDLLCEMLGQSWLLVYCSRGECGLQNNDPMAFFRKCSVCKTMRYCSRECQVKHWDATHKYECKRIARNDCNFFSV